MVVACFTEFHPFLCVPWCPKACFALQKEQKKKTTKLTKKQAKINEAKKAKKEKGNNAIKLAFCESN
jgi:Na+-translocating ferredoxin:NAD+ oxidoreductase RNF subunit RnfB